MFQFSWHILNHVKCILPAFVVSFYSSRRRNGTAADDAQPCKLNGHVPFPSSSFKCLCWVSRLLAVAAHDPDLIRLYCLTGVLHLKSDVLDQECPDFVAETVGIQVALLPVSLAHPLTRGYSP